jgi:hypothetical protein
MKILIYGEYSGYGKSLAMGFRELGQEAAVFSPSGDGWKQVSTEFGLSAKTKIGRFKQLLMLFPFFLQFDVVYIMNPKFFRFGLMGPLLLLLFKIKKIKIYLLACGDDVEYIRAGESGVLEKFVYADVDYPVKNYLKTKREKFVNYLCANMANKIIPTMYDYELPWKTSRFAYKVTKVIPLACYIESIPSIKKTDISSIKILHGINRPSVKGTETILAALKRIEAEFENVLIYKPKRMVQSEYLALFSQIDISIDQTKGHSYGMNAIYAMLNGHIVLAPADKKCCESFNIDKSPIISISNDEDVIYREIKKILLNPQDMDKLKLDTQLFAKKMHLPSHVCEKMIGLIDS